MPNFTVSDRPVQVSQTGTQEALIRNTGNSSVFLDAQSSVSSLNSGLELQPFDSVNWPTGQDLWAVCAPGNSSTVTILYGASGVSLGAVSAVVTGDVTATIDGPVNANITNASIPVTGTVNANVTNANIPVTGTVNANITNANIPVTGTVNANITNANIDATVTGNIIVDSGEVNVGGILTPVIIQGGGEALGGLSGPLIAGASVSFDVDPPANGQTFYAYRVDFQVTSAAHATADRAFKYTDSFDNQTYVVMPPITATQVGIPQRHVFTVPGSAGTYTITITNISTVTANFFISVDGINVSSPTPQTDMGILLANQSIITATPPTVAPESHVWFPPSFQPYHALLRTNSSTGFINVMRQTYMGSAGAVAAYNVYTTRAWNTNGYLDRTVLDNTALGAVVSRDIPVTGNGQPCRFEFAVSGSNVGSVVMAINS